MKKSPPKAPWFIWLSFLGLMFLNGKHSIQCMAGKPKYTGKEFDRHCGYTVRLIGLFIGVFGIPTLLMEYLIMDRMPEPWYTVWNCIVLVYAYFAGVFITWRLYRYLNRE